MRLRGRLVCALHECGLPLLLVASLVCAAAGVLGPARVAVAVLVVQAARLAVAHCDLSLRMLGTSASRRAYAGRTVWVVGASQGLGGQVALDLASCGARVVLSSRRADALQEVATKCSALGAAGTHVVTLDLNELDSVVAASQVVSAVASEHGGLAYCFLLAGGTQRAAAEDTQPAVDARLVQLNALGLMALAKAALPAMRLSPSSRVVVVSSAAGKLASPGQAGYAATKHALNGFFASLRSELAGSGVGVTVVCPGPVATGAPGQPRVTFGATLGTSALGGGKSDAAGHHAAGTPEKARLSLREATAWTLAAGAHGVREAWVARHPILLLLFISQYCPLLAGTIIDARGPKRVLAAREGGDMYK